MRITKVTTRNGDGGKTNLAKGESVLKSDNIIHCLGEVDELSSTIGVCLSFSQNSDITEFLKKIQNNLFDIGGHISMNLEDNSIINENMISNVLNKYELESFKSDLVGDFSSGMVKRSEIAIADLKNPKVLCIDEPRVYLDENGVDLLLNLIKKREKEGNTSILSSQESIGAFTSIERSFNLND